MAKVSPRAEQTGHQAQASRVASARQHAARLTLTVQSGELGRSGTVGGIVGPDRAIRAESGSMAWPAESGRPGQTSSSERRSQASAAGRGE
jgi:hypothetical protein